MVEEDEVEEEGGGVNQHATNTASASDEKQKVPMRPPFISPTSSPRIIVGTLLCSLMTFTQFK